jgi:spermidine synthase
MRRFAFYGGLFLVTAATLMLQLIQTRILSVVAWYHLAFFVISIAMFGLTAGAVWVYLRRERFTEATLSHDLGYHTAAFAATAALSLAVQLTLPPLSQASLLSALIWAELAIALSVPFFFSGVVVSLALTRSPYPIGFVYGVDLIGAALGCLGVLLLLDLVRGPTAVLWVATTVAAAAILFSRSGIGTAPAGRLPFAWLLRRPAALLLMLAAAALANDLAAPGGLHPQFVKGKIERLDQRIFEEWNSFSRIVVFETGNPRPHMWGPSPTYVAEDWPTAQRGMNIDGAAGTTTYGVAGEVERAGFLRYDVTNLAYFLPGLDKAAVIGVGGGRDLLSARLFGVSEVTGVEINPILARLLTREPGFAPFSGIRDMDGVSIETDEARSWMARSEETYDIIQMSLVDTWAATGAGAYSLSENGLYTVEAWRTFLERLEPNGVFTVSRWYAPSRPEQTGRVVSVGMAALFESGATEPRRHIFLASSGRIANLILSPEPLSPAALDALERAAAEMEYTVLIDPRRPSMEPVLREIVESESREALERHTAAQTLDLTPSTDDRPFFFNQLPLYDPIRTIRLAFVTGEAGVVSGNLFATATLLILFLISAVLVLATIVVPLRPVIRDVGRRLAWGGTAYFSLIGMGFMMVEIGLLQRMSVFLGHPIYSLSFVLFSIILATGIGSMISDRVPLDGPRRLFAWAVAIALYLLVLPLWLPAILLTFDGAALPVRAGLCVLTIAPVGLLMGFGFPTGMRLISAVDRRPTPWFWGINGAAGVMAASIAAASSIAFGIGTTFILAAACYLLLIPAALTIGFRTETARCPSPEPAELVGATGPAE